LSLTPEVTVAAIVVRDRRYLLVEEEIGGELVFNQPAGHVERGETLLEAVVRETLEETGWDFVPAALLGVYLWTHPTTDRTTLRFAFIGAVTRHHAERPLDRGIVAPHWLTREQIVARQARLRSPLVLRCVEDHLTGRRVSLDTVACLDLDTAHTARNLRAVML
jgi:8-oxo-dGTP pyrophosphatase MutT (NUDIX family)